MKTLYGYLTTVAIGAVAWLLLGVLDPVLRPVIRRIRDAVFRAYSPPLGALTLTLTWVAALALTLGAVAAGPAATWSESWRWARFAVTLLALPLATLVSFVFRDRRRAARGLPPVGELREGRAGWIIRTWAALFAAISLLAALVVPGLFGDAVSARSVGRDLATVLPGTVMLAWVAATGRLPRIGRRAAAARTDGAGRRPDA